jgi:hypothetical protein
MSLVIILFDFAKIVVNTQKQYLTVVNVGLSIHTQAFKSMLVFPFELQIHSKTQHQYLKDLPPFFSLFASLDVKTLSGRVNASYFPLITEVTDSFASMLAKVKSNNVLHLIIIV